MIVENGTYWFQTGGTFRFFIRGFQVRRNRIYLTKRTHWKCENFKLRRMFEKSLEQKKNKLRDMLCSINL